MVKDGLIILEGQREYYDKAVEIALNHGITVYDALYMAQAKKYDATLLTSDKTQTTISKKIKIKTRYIPEKTGMKTILKNILEG